MDQTNKISQFVLDHLFYKHVTKEGEVIYWKDCILRPNELHGTQGYIWVYSDGEHFHSYRTPENL